MSPRGKPCSSCRRPPSTYGGWPFRPTVAAWPQFARSTTRTRWSCSVRRRNSSPHAPREDMHHAEPTRRAGAPAYDGLLAQHDVVRVLASLDRRRDSRFFRFPVFGRHIEKSRRRSLGSAFAAGTLVTLGHLPTDHLALGRLGVDADLDLAQRSVLDFVPPLL